MGISVSTVSEQVVKLTEEEWITRRSHEVTSWVTSDNEVTGSVNAHEVVHEVVRRRAAL